MIPVSGFRIHRLRQNLTIQKTAEQSGLSVYAVRACEDGNVGGMSIEKVLALADALDITIDEGCRFYAWQITKRRVHEKHTHGPLERYMDEKGLSAEGLADMLGVSVQTVSVQRRKPIPNTKYIEFLAKEEGVSVSEFLTRYKGVE